MTGDGFGAGGPRVWAAPDQFRAVPSVPRFSSWRALRWPCSCRLSLALFLHLLRLARAFPRTLPVLSHGDRVLEASRLLHPRSTACSPAFSLSLSFLSLYAPHTALLTPRPPLLRCPTVPTPPSATARRRVTRTLPFRTARHAPTCPLPQIRHPSFAPTGRTRSAVRSFLALQRPASCAQATIAAADGGRSWTGDGRGVLGGTGSAGHEPRLRRLPVTCSPGRQFGPEPADASGTP